MSALFWPFVWFYATTVKNQLSFSHVLPKGEKTEEYVHAVVLELAWDERPPSHIAEKGAIYIAKQMEQRINVSNTQQWHSLAMGSAWILCLSPEYNQILDGQSHVWQDLLCGQK